MAIAIFPKRWSAKPPLGVKINPGHPLTQGLSVCFLLNENGGIQINSSVNPYQFGTFESNAPTWSPGKDGVQLTFVGASAQTVDLFNMPIMGSGNFSSFMWIKPAASFTSNVVWMADSTNAEALYGGASSTIYYFPAGAGSNTSLGIGVWNFVGVAIDGGGGVTYYLNGRADGTSSGSFNAKYNRLGFRGANTPFDGSMGPIYVWTRTLTASEIFQLYLDPYCFFQPQSPQRRYWPSAAVAAYRPTLNQLRPRPFAP